MPPDGSPDSEPNPETVPGTLGISVIDGLSAVSGEDWDRLANPRGVEFDPFLSWTFLQALEESGCVGGDTGWVPHHLIDLVDPEERYSVGQYRRDVLDLLPRFEEAGRIPFFVGGTGFYLKAVLEGLCPGPEANVDLRRWLQKAAAYPAGGLHSLLQRIDAESADRTHRNDSYRLTRALEVYYVTGEPLSARQKRHRFSDRPFRTVIVGLTREKGEG